MKCINCKQYFYYNIKTNKLVCQNKRCNFNPNPEYIIWKCAKCSKDFNSKVKPYNPLEYKIYKKELYYTLLNRNKARPLNINKCINCKKFINSDNIIFFHNNECKGELFKGRLFNKDIIACIKCKYISYLDNFIWTCPLCKKIISNNKNENNENNHDNNKDQNGLISKYNSHTLIRNNGNERNSPKLFYSLNNSKRNLMNTIEYNDNYYKNTNIYSRKKKVKSIRALLSTMFISLENNKKTKIKKIHNCIINPDTFREKDSLNHTSSKYSLNNSNNSSLSNSKNSLIN
jgi:hypothetical protein